MCGIIGGITHHETVTPYLIQGLISLEYRGYDSSGVLVKDTLGEFNLLKTVGGPSCLAKHQDLSKIKGSFGIGHNRWATHGEVTQQNAHPHVVSFQGLEIGIVHNGVVENLELITSLIPKEILDTLSSNTDSVLIAALMVSFCFQGLSFEESFEKVTQLIQGQYAILALHSSFPILLAKCSQLPLCVGMKDNHFAFVASDPMALPNTISSHYVLLSNSTLKIDETGAMYLNGSNWGEAILTTGAHQQQSRGAFGSFMEKEIYEQPNIIEMLMREGIDKDIYKELDEAQEVHLIGCGTSYHAAYIGAIWIEQKLGKAARAFIASEFRFYPPIVNKKTLLIVLSQSGETADVLAALHEHQHHYHGSLGLTNHAYSSVARLVDKVLLLNTGKEVGVASTKAFSAQLTLLWLLIQADKEHHSLLGIALKRSMDALLCDQKAWELAELFRDDYAMMILGRGDYYALAMEGALKIKEISYMHAHHLPTSELKHGSLALIDRDCPVIMFLPQDEHLHKNLLTCQELLARKARLLVIADNAVAESLPKEVVAYTLPAVPHLCQSLLFTIPLQMMALRLATWRGLCVDQPRHLAKSVTVE